MTRELWESQYRSVKLSAVIDIIRYHLAQDNQPVLRVEASDRAQLQLGPDPTFTPPKLPHSSLGPDKIVIFSAFTKNVPRIREVLLLHNIAFSTYNGSMNAMQRKDTIKDFRTANGPRVLLMSKVGSQGLNLDCANILIVLVSFGFALHKMTLTIMQLSRF